MGCPDEKTLSSYLDERIGGVERGNIESHISSCNRCLQLLLVAYDAGRLSRKCPLALKEKVRSRLGLRQKKKRAELKWLSAAIIFFALSFIFKRYFLQFLVAGSILGLKWAVEGDAARRTIMIFRGIQKKEKNFERKTPPPVSRINEDTDYGAE